MNICSSPPGNRTSIRGFKAARKRASNWHSGTDEPKVESEEDESELEGSNPLRLAGRTPSRGRITSGSRLSASQPQYTSSSSADDASSTSFGKPELSSELTSSLTEKAYRLDLQHRKRMADTALLPCPKRHRIDIRTSSIPSILPSVMSSDNMSRNLGLAGPQKKAARKKASDLAIDLTVLDSDDDSSVFDSSDASDEGTDDRGREDGEAYEFPDQTGCHTGSLASDDGEETDEEEIEAIYLRAGSVKEKEGNLVNGSACQVSPSCTQHAESRRITPIQEGPSPVRGVRELPPPTGTQINAGQLFNPHPGKSDLVPLASSERFAKSRPHSPHFALDTSESASRPSAGMVGSEQAGNLHVFRHHTLGLRTNAEDTLKSTPGNSTLDVVRLQSILQTGAAGDKKGSISPRDNSQMHLFAIDSNVAEASMANRNRSADVVEVVSKQIEEPSQPDIHQPLLVSGSQPSNLDMEAPTQLLVASSALISVHQAVHEQASTNDIPSQLPISSDLSPSFDAPTLNPMNLSQGSAFSHRAPEVHSDIHLILPGFARQSKLSIFSRRLLNNQSRPPFTTGYMSRHHSVTARKPFLLRNVRMGLSGLASNEFPDKPSSVKFQQRLKEGQARELRMRIKKGEMTLDMRDVGFGTLKRDLVARESQLKTM